MIGKQRRDGAAGQRGRGQGADGRGGGKALAKAEGDAGDGAIRRFEVNAPSGWSLRCLVIAGAYTILVLLLLVILQFVRPAVGFWISVVAILWPVVMVLCGGAFLLVDFLLRWKLTFDLDSRRVGRQITWRTEPHGPENPVWIKADDVTAVHLHRCDFFGTPWEALFLARRGGGRVLLYEARPRLKAIEDLFLERPPRLKGRELDALAKRIAEFGGCPLSRYDTFLVPKTPPAIEAGPPSSDGGSDPPNE